MNKTTWLVDNNSTRWRLVTVTRVEFGNRVTVTLYNGDELTVKAESLRTWKI